MAKDYYKILGVEKNASQEDIKKAYKRLAKQYHPDVNKNADASEKFKEVNEAASVLGNEQKRQQYDQFGTAGPQDFSGFDFRDFGNVDDIFDNLFAGFGFGGGRRHGGQQRGHDLSTEITVSLKDVVAGVAKKIPVDRKVSCEECKGTGAKSGGKITCETCNGQGVVRQARQTMFGVFATTTTCRKCSGAGETVKDPCKKCHGEGRVEEEREIEIRIPAGVESGMRLRISGEGEAGVRGAPAGDLYVSVVVEDDERFARDGQDLSLEIPIGFSLACLGGEIEIPTLEEPVTLKIPAGTQGGTVFRLKNHGLPSVHGGGRGSLFVKTQIEVPKKLTKKQTEALKEFENDTKKKGWFF